MAFIKKLKKNKLQKNKLQKNKLQHRVKRWLLLVFSSFLTVILLGVNNQALGHWPLLGAALPTVETTVVAPGLDASLESPLELGFDSTLKSSLESTVEPIASLKAAETETTTMIKAGIGAFESGQFSAAIAHWQQALNTTADPLSQAYLLSNLANAYQRLGQYSDAQRSLAEGLSLLKDWDELDQDYWSVSARVLNTQGQLQWQQGQSAAALKSWQAAESQYREVLAKQTLNQNSDLRSDQTSSGPSPIQSAAQNGAMQTQINQALALQDLGFNAQAAQQLDQLSQQLNQQLPNASSTLKLTIAKELCKAMRGVGELDNAQEMLTAVLATAAFLEDTPTVRLARAQLQMELGHTLRSLSHRAIALGETAEANQTAELALDYYKQASDTANSTTAVPKTVELALLNTQAQLNQLSYLIEIDRLSAAQTLWPTIDLSALPVGRASAEAYISYAHSLNCLRSPIAHTCTKREWLEGGSASLEADRLVAKTQLQTGLLPSLTTSLTTAVEQAKSLSDPLMEAYAIGELGHAYELSGQRDDAIQLTQQALALLEGRQMPEVSYRWEWQLGRLYQPLSQQPQQNRYEQALSAYQQAVESLSTARQSLLRIDPQVQFSFRDNVEPVYREFVALLLKSPLDARQLEAQQAVSQTVSQVALKQAVKTLDELQLTELENFLGCDLSQVVTLSTAGTDPKAIKIYPIVLPQQLAIIIEPPGQPLILKTVDVSEQTLEATLAALRENLTLPGKTPAVLTAASQLYDWLMLPIEPVLAQYEQVETLVFVPDGLLRNVPMGVLYDGEQYLVEKDYAIAIAPQLDLFAPRRAPDPLQILRGGIGLPQTVRGQAFPPIELIQAELDQIPEQLTASQPLINEAFTQANIEKQLANEKYSAIHWKTHGVFSSDPGETFLVAYQDGITANELSLLVQSASQQQAEPLELLVLSACETAQGDRRAVLGLAGMAVRAGARSTLSTLWRADDGANTALMASFYQGLETGLTKSQSLHQAQQQLLAELGYPAPYYWAPYVLVGNWL